MGSHFCGAFGIIYADNDCAIDIHGFGCLCDTLARNLRYDHINLAQELDTISLILDCRRDKQCILSIKSENHLLNKQETDKEIIRKHSKNERYKLCVWLNCNGNG